MFQLISPDINIDFIRWRKTALIASGVLNLAALLALIVVGPRYGIDFSGGTLLQLRFKPEVTVSQVREALTGIEGDVSVQDYGAEKGQYLVRTPLAAEEKGGSVGGQIRGHLDAAFGAGAYEVLRSETVGPRVGSDLRRRAFLAVIFATLMMSAYIAFRFEPRFGIGAAIALVHDVLMTVGALILFGYDFDLTVVAALLTIVGFSVNDTVIISDRIRENMRKSRREPLASLINRSINETLSRTVLTTGTVLLVVIALFLLGGPVIHGFAFALLVGFIVGTYSTVFIAAPIVLAFEGRSAQSSSRMAAEEALEGGRSRRG